MPIAESFLMVKGAIAIAHWLAAHGTSAMAAKGGAMIAKSVAVNGLATTATTVTTIATTSSLAVGYVLWTTDRLKLVGDGLQAMCDGDIKKMAGKFAKLALMLDIDFEYLPDAIEDLLHEKFDYSYENAHKVAQIVHSYEKEINREMNKRRK
jgi:hypothetical protein